MMPATLTAEMRSRYIFSLNAEFEFRDSTLYVYSTDNWSSTLLMRHQREIAEGAMELLGQAYPIKFLVRPKEESKEIVTANRLKSQVQGRTRVGSLEGELVQDISEESSYELLNREAEVIDLSGNKIRYQANSGPNKPNQIKNTTRITADHDLLSVFEPGQSIAQMKQESARDMMTTRKVVGEGSKSDQVEPRHPSVNQYQFASDGSNTVLFRPSVRPRDKEHRSFATYGSFVKGISNQLATQIGEIAITSPGMINPAFISGPSGVGKTHLLQGIWDEFRKRHDKPACFMRAEQFTTLFIQSLMKKDGSFRKRFKDISLFILDDLQFLQGKRDTQIEFLSLFDQLRAEGVQIIVSADRPLRELTEIRHEIRSRIQSGACCSIELPEKETLLKIFNAKAQAMGLEVPDDVARYVVSRFSNSAPQLSGVLNRLLMARQITRQPLTLAFAETALSDMVRSNQRLIRLEDIEKAVQDTFGLPDKSLRGRSRVKQVAWPRMLAFWLARKYTRNALSEIGRYFGNRSHSTVVSAQKKVDQMVSTSPAEADETTLPLPEALHRIERLLQV